MWKISITAPMISLLTMGVIFIACTGNHRQIEVQFGQKWKIHDKERPLPPVVDPGSYSTQEKIGKAPSDATVLFDGKDLSQWEMANGDPPKWKLGKGYMEVVPETGTIRTKQGFGDCQLHIEWAAPAKVVGKGQGRGNSGVFLMGIYEVQVLDSYENETYADGQAAAVYGQYPPLVNACQPPGEWQSYDIIWHRPRFNESGKLLSAARVTVLHNGILVQDNVTLTGPTENKARPPYKTHLDKLSLTIQDHGNPVQYRNIWIKEL